MDNTEKKPSEWINHIDEIIISNSVKSFLSKDKFGKEVILEWIKTDMLSPKYSSAMKSVWKIACQTYTTIEMDFLKAHPEVVGSDAHFKPFESLFKAGINNVDWNLVKEKMQNILKGIFIFDSSIYSNEMKKSLENVRQIFVSLKDKENGKQLGFITFLISPKYKHGYVKSIALSILPKEQNRGLGKLAMSSIFKIIPQTKSIFLCTRITNQKAKNAYLNWGFVENRKLISTENQYTFNKDHWIFMEYKSKEADVLQKLSKKIVVKQLNP
ncbi:GNAT family N-acetyltransferase [Candidatus Babeliales bacterium]|nr:GNAT family N-acetyltransferase [Candidatus Babeliales bacterium]